MADEVIIAGIFKSEAIPAAERLDLEEVVRALDRRGRSARQLPDADAIVSAIVPELRSGDVVAILSNGGFGGIYEKLPRLLKSREVTAKA
jgi:UDP-N-acetylmuramate: L-alanyl-gamma-D-glutamyl-meso-diaminopimelate ligase